MMPVPSGPFNRAIPPFMKGPFDVSVYFPERKLAV
jgi:hypothetical protein